MHAEKSDLYVFLQKYTVFQKSDAKIEITITTTNLIRIRLNILLAAFNYRLSGANNANFNLPQAVTPLISILNGGSGKRSASPS